MVFQPVPNAVEVDVNMILDDQLCQNTLYGRNPTGAPTQSDMQALANAIRDWWATYYAPLVGEGVRLRDVEVKGLWSQAAPYALSASSATGEVISSMLPNHNTWVIKFVTGLIGRSQRGRNFVVGLTEAQVTNNEITATLANLFVAAYNELPDAFSVGSMEWCIVSRRTNGALRPEGVTFEVSGCSYEDLYIDSQRRRLPGRGR